MLARVLMAHRGKAVLANTIPFEKPAFRAGDFLEWRLHRKFVEQDFCRAGQVCMASISCFKCTSCEDAMKGLRRSCLSMPIESARSATLISKASTKANKS